MADISAAAALSLKDAGSINLSLDFYGSEQQPKTISNKDGFSLIGAPPGLHRESEDLQNVSAPLFLHASAFGWRVQLRGPDYHPFGSCTPRGVPVKHFNLEFMRHIGSGRYVTVKNFHFGTYRQGTRCFVLYQNVAPGIVCWKACNPSKGQLQTMIAWGLVVAVAIAGAYLASWAVASIATTAALVFFLPLLLSV